MSHSEEKKRICALRSAHPGLQMTYAYTPAAAGEVESVPLHADEFHRLVFVVSGDATVTAPGGLSRHCGQGLIFYKAGQPHSQVNALSVPYERYYVDFPPEATDPYIALFPALGKLLSGDSFYLALREEDFAAMAAWVGALLRLAGEKMPPVAAGKKDGETVVSAEEKEEAPLLLCAILMHAASLLRYQKMPGERIPYILSVTEYIDAHLTEKLTIESLTDRFHVSRGKLTADFKRATCSTVNDYVTERRLDLSVRMLLEEKSVTETALLCGFATPEYFISVFRAHNGTTPKHFGNLLGGFQLSMFPDCFD